MTSIKSMTKEAVKESKSIVKNSGSTLDEMSNALKTHFSSTKLSEIRTAYESAIASQPDGKNTSLVAGIESYLDIISETVDQIQTLDRCLTLHVPQMEDGNNFGVTVQMMVSKVLNESREKLNKLVASIPTYHSARADAVDKLGLQKNTTSSSKTTTNVESKGGKDGDESKTSTSTVSEEKTAGSAGVDEKMILRLTHLVSLDVQCYFELRTGLVECRDLYLMIIDNMEKNKAKLETPKGSGGSNSMGMY